MNETSTNFDSSIVENPVQFIAELEENIGDFFLKLVSDAIGMSVNDIFISPADSRCDVSVRRLGIVEPVCQLTTEEGARLVSFIKAKAEMDIAQRFQPQDGRVSVTLEEGGHYDLRVATLPSLFGECLTLRVLDPKKTKFGIEEIGFHPTNMRRVISLLDKPGGLILVAGPTGTGKTTTLYSVIRQLNDGKRKIHTLEDPIEYVLDGVVQSQINPRRGVDYADLLRGVLRQSPDIIMVGEIRDSITAEILVRAANTGQLVLATSHSASTAEAIEALLTFGVKAQFLASALLGVISQRLVRPLCPECKIPLDDECTKTQVYMPHGCPSCRQTGYCGRVAVGEVMLVSPTIRKLIHNAAPVSTIRQVAIDEGMIDLRTDAQDKVDKGLTSADEILRTVPADNLGIEPAV
ncbi:MAG: GspE/PulE family protein [Planctomycetaceae bacterium]|nr:GspE/PulE family protein [Planctomycetaceae bacterium]